MEGDTESARGTFYWRQGLWVESERAMRTSLRLLQARLQNSSSSPNKINELSDEPRTLTDGTNTPRYAITQLVNRLQGLSDVMKQQRKLVDAEYYAREALQLALNHVGRNSVGAGNSLAQLSSVVSEQGRKGEAVLLAKASLAAIRESGVTDDSWVMAEAKKFYATALVGNGQYQEADLAFVDMQNGLNADIELVKSFRLDDLDRVIATQNVGKLAESEAMALRMYKKFEVSAGKNSPRTALVGAFYAVALQRQNKWAEAQSVYRTSMPVLMDETRSDAENDTTSAKQQQRMTYLLENYLSLLAHTANANPNQFATASAEAFMIADLAKGSGVQRALTASAARANIKDVNLAQLARKEQDLQRRLTSLSELLTGLLSAPVDQQLPAIQAKIKLDLVSFKAEREALKKEIERKFPEYAEMVEPKPASVEKTRKLLRPDEVLVSWYFGEQEGYVWAISKDGTPLFKAINLGRAQVAKQVAALRLALDPGVATIDEIPAFDIAAANGLYDQLLAPVSESLKGKKVMLVVPHAELGQLPLSVLVTKAMPLPAKTKVGFENYKSVPWLIRDIAIAQLPSVTALAALRNTPPGNPNRKNFIGFGDPYFSAAQQKSADKVKPAELATRGIPLALRSAPKTAGVSSAELALLPRLPDTKQEIQEIGNVLSAGSGDIFLNKQASVKTVMEMDLSNRKVVMFATHGLVPGELNGLTQPALALSSPDVTGDADDGLLTMDKVLSLKLDADWVVLSACNTASGEGSGSEAVSGLGRAFFFAGAKALLVSNWPVDSVAARHLMTDLFSRHQAGGNVLTKSESLRQAMLHQIDQGGVASGNSMSYVYAHPLFWAPFMVVGD
jgi:CHAT domain-containing protein